MIRFVAVVAVIILIALLVILRLLFRKYSAFCSKEHLKNYEGLLPYPLEGDPRDPQSAKYARRYNLVARTGMFVMVVCCLIPVVLAMGEYFTK